MKVPRQENFTPPATPTQEFPTLEQLLGGRGRQPYTACTPNVKDMGVGPEPPIEPKEE